MDFIKLIWAICRFQQGPEDVPYSPTLFLVAFIANFCLVVLGLIDEQPWDTVVFNVLLLLILTSAAIGVLLRIRKVFARLLQTLTAIFASSALLTTLTLPMVLCSMLLFKIFPPNAPIQMVQFFFIMIFFAIFIWSIAVDGWILSKSLNISRGFGLMWAVVFEFLNIYLYGLLF